MSIRGAHQVAAIARAKLLHEAGSKDHDLRRIVHHAILYDTLLQQCYDEEEQAKAVSQRIEKYSCSHHIEWTDEKHEEPHTICEVLDLTESKVEAMGWGLGSDGAVAISEVELDAEVD